MKGSMRTLIVLALGFMLGAFAAATVSNALARRDAYARATMQVLQHQYGLLREHVRAASCASVDAAPARRLLSLLGDEIEASAFPGETPPPPFREYVGRLREAVAALPEDATSCAALAPLVSRVGQACDACHQQYR
jgi:hypothetical protein